MKRLIALTLLIAVSLGGTARAEEGNSQEPVRASQYQRSDEGPAIIIRNEQDKTYYEYRVNGEIQEIKVEPAVGPTYYLIPVEGGYIRREDSGLRLPSWVLFSW